jgi:hypothetical protein
VLRGKPGQPDTHASTPGLAQAVKPTAIPAAQNENPVREPVPAGAPPPELKLTTRCATSAPEHLARVGIRIGLASKG